MLRIRFSRTGKRGQPSYRIVVAEHRNPVKGRYIENIGNYMPARNPKIVSINKERLTYWISKGAIPTDSAAALFKKEGIDNMEKYLEPRTKKRLKKGEQAEAKPAEAKAETKKEEKPAEQPAS